MDREQSIAYVNAMCVAAQVELAAMVAANQESLANGHSITYDEETIRGVIDEFGISHNAVLTTLGG